MVNLKRNPYGNSYCYPYLRLASRTVTYIVSVLPFNNRTTWNLEEKCRILALALAVDVAVALALALTIALTLAVYLAMPNLNQNSLTLSWP